jgi:hypothetical protein
MSQSEQTNVALTLKIPAEAATAELVLLRLGT